MTILLNKFGAMLTSRQLGQEAFAAYRPTLRGLRKGESLAVDFAGVTTFSPSWGDEFLGALLGMIEGKLVLKHTTNPSVRATLRLLERIHGPRLRIES